ncbi:MAG TPA: VWA domain-containing protein [Dehalococcoidia bacterium]|nr:VWA domain-containing protein [Dehalococcoidia bacterium]
MNAKRWALTVLVPVSLALLSTPLGRAQEPTLQAQVTSVTDAGYPNARAVISIDDTSGAEVTQLTPADFSVTVNGKDAEVISAELASSENAPLDVLFVMDTSGSMAGEPIAQAKAAAKTLIAGLAPGDRVGVISFGDAVTVLQDYTDDRAAAERAIDSLEAVGNTALYQATADAAVKAATSSASRRAIVLLSDGADFGGKSNVGRQQAIDAVVQAGVPFFAVAEGTDIDVDYLNQVAFLSRGRFLSAPTPDELNGLYAGIAKLLRSQYVLTFDATAAGTEDAGVEIDVRAAGRSAHASARFRAVAVPAPTIAISGVSQGERLDSIRTISVEVGGPPATRVVFRVDGVNVAEALAPPYEYVFDPRNFEPGDHQLSVTVETAARPAEQSIAFSSAEPASGGSLSPVAVVAVAAVVLLMPAVATFLVLRARARRNLGPSVVGEIAALRARPAVSVVLDDEDRRVQPETIDEPAGILVSRAGSDLGSEYVVGAHPVSVGSGDRCAVRIADRGLSQVEARVWVRNGQLMVHRMVSLNALQTEGTTGGWQILDPGDKFDIGPHTYEFRLLPEPQGDAPQEPAASAPRVRRDATPPLPAFEGRLAELMPRDSFTPDASDDDAESRQAS